MNSATVIVGLGCIFLATMYFLFRSQILVLLGRLANIEFRTGEKQWTNSETVAPKDTKPWNWYQAWRNALFYPTEDTWDALLSQNSISFKKAYLWITITSVLFPLVYSIVTWLKFPQETTTRNIVSFGRNVLLIGLLEPAGFVVITGIIHILGKGISGKGVFRNFFVLFATAYAPISCLYTLMALIRWSLAFKIGLYAGVLLNFYFIAFVFTEIIAFNYHVNRLVALFINIVVTVLSYIAVIGIYTATGLGL